MATNLKVKIGEIGRLTSPFVALAFQKGVEYRNSDLKRRWSGYTVWKFGELWSSNSGVLTAWQAYTLWSISSLATFAWRCQC